MLLMHYLSMLCLCLEQATPSPCAMSETTPSPYSLSETTDPAF